MRPRAGPLQQSGRVEAFAFGPDGLLVMTRGAAALCVWQVPTPQTKTTRLQLPAGAPREGVRPPVLNKAALSLDGRRVATACGEDQEACVWETETGKQLATIKTYGNPSALGLSPGGKIVAVTASYQKGVAPTTRLWDVDAGNPLVKALPETGAVNALTFSPDARILLTGFSPHAASGKIQKYVHLAGAPAGDTLAQFSVGDRSSPLAAAFSPDGKTLVTGQSIAQRWDAVTHKPVGKPLYGPPSSYVEALAWSPDGKTLAWVDQARRAIRFWDANTGMALAAPFFAVQEVRAVGFSADGRQLITVYADASVQWWDAPLAPLDGPADQIVVWGGGLFKTAVGQAPLDGPADRVVLWVQVLTGLELGANDAVHELDPNAWQERRRQLEQGGAPPKPRPAPTATFTATETADLWRVVVPAEQLTPEQLKERAHWLLAAGNGQALAYHDNKPRLLDLATGRDRAPVKGPPLEELQRPWAISADGMTLVAVSGSGRDSRFKIWDLAAGKERGPAPPLHPARLNGPPTLALAPDGKTLATNYNPFHAPGMRPPLRFPPVAVQLWDVAAGAQLALLQGHAGDIVSLAFAPDGLTLASAASLAPGPAGGKAPGPPSLILWDVAARQKRHALAHPGPVSALAFAPDGKILAAGSPAKLCLWDVSSGQLKATLQEEPGPLAGLAFSPDGRTLAAASATAVKLWDVSGGRERASHSVTSPIQAVTFCADGETLAILHGGGKPTLWKAGPGKGD